MKYEDLLARTDAPAGSTWGLFGPGDQLGTMNLQTPQTVLRGLRTVRDGRVINLDYPLQAFDPPMAKSRRLLEQRIYQIHRDHRDEVLDSFYPQASSQIDGLRHRRHAVHGFYNAVPDSAVDVGSPALGIGHWAEHGIVGRAVLIDLARHFSRAARPFDPLAGEAIDVSVLDEALAAQQVQIEPGDMVLIRTGWTETYFGLGPAQRRELVGRAKSAGLAQSHDTLAWIWDHGVSLLAADNVAVEALPASPRSPFDSDTDGGLMHQQLIALLGLALGELWNLTELAEASAADGRYECLVVAKPLNLIGGVGSPANAVAIR